MPSAWMVGRGAMHKGLVAEPRAVRWALAKLFDDLRFAGFVLVLFGAGRSNGCGVHHGARVKKQTALDQQIVGVTRI